MAKFTSQRQTDATSAGQSTMGEQSAGGPDSDRVSRHPPFPQIFIDLHHDESSGLDPAVASKSLEHVRNYALGEKIARGMVVTFGERTPHIHILDTEIKPILQSLEYYRDKLAECVDKYQRVQGKTPSKAGCRVFSMVLRKVVSNQEARRELKTICDEALAIDLSSPQDKQ